MGSNVWLYCFENNILTSVKTPTPAKGLAEASSNYYDTMVLLENGFSWKSTSTKLGINPVQYIALKNIDVSMILNNFN